MLTIEELFELAKGTQIQIQSSDHQVLVGITGSEIAAAAMAIFGAAMLTHKVGMDRQAIEALWARAYRSIEEEGISSPVMVEA
jgi:hypothetical protein